MVVFTSFAGFQNINVDLPQACSFTDGKTKERNEGSSASNVGFPFSVSYCASNTLFFHYNGRHKSSISRCKSSGLPLQFILCIQILLTVMALAKRTGKLLLKWEGRYEACDEFYTLEIWSVSGTEPWSQLHQWLDYFHCNSSGTYFLL